MEGRLTSVFERVLTTLVSDIEHIESQTLDGMSVVKVFFQPNADNSNGQWRRRRLFLRLY